MSVLHDINQHSQKQYKHLQRFLEMDQAREQAIEEAIEAYWLQRGFTVEKINHITAQINEHAKKGISPVRAYVTEAMLRDAAGKLNPGD